MPRNDSLNDTVNIVNELIRENYKSIKNLTIIEHDNILSAEKPVLHDTKHLNKVGVSLFARNLTKTIYKDTNFARNQRRIYNSSRDSQYRQQRPPAGYYQSPNQFQQNAKHVSFDTFQSFKPSEPVYRYSDAVKRNGQHADSLHPGPELLNAVKLLNGILSRITNQ